MTRSRDAMRRALLTLLDRTPLAAITGAMIAEQARIGYATFFRHYADVHALLVDTVATITDELAEAMMPALLSADSGGAATALITAIAARRPMFTALLSGAGDALRAELARAVIARISALPDLLPPELPRSLALRISVTATIDLLDWWLREEPERDPAEVAALFDRLVIARLGGKAVR